jgi:hypothetical protein
MSQSSSFSTVGTVGNRLLMAFEALDHVGSCKPSSISINFSHLDLILWWFVGSILFHLILAIPTIPYSLHEVMWIFSKLAIGTGENYEKPEWAYRIIHSHNLCAKIKVKSIGNNLTMPLRWPGSNKICRVKWHLCWLWLRWPILNHWVAEAETRFTNRCKNFRDVLSSTNITWKDMKGVFRAWTLGVPEFRSEHFFRNDKVPSLGPLGLSRPQGEHSEHS